MTLKDMIVEYRTEHGLSQRQFGAACGLSGAYISMLEKELNPATGEKIVPTLHALQKLSNGMHITLTELLTEVDDMPVDISIRPKLNESPDMDAEIAYLIHKLSPEKRREFMNYLRFLAQSEDSTL